MCGGGFKGRTWVDPTRPKPHPTQADPATGQVGALTATVCLFVARKIGFSSRALAAKARLGTFRSVAMPVRCPPDGWLCFVFRYGHVMPMRIPAEWLRYARIRWSSQSVEASGPDKLVTFRHVRLLPLFRPVQAIF